MRRSRPIVPLAVLGLCLAASAAAGELQSDLRTRRGRLMERLGPEAIFVAWSAPPSVYSRNIHYEYRQDSNLYYLTGIEQEQTILVLMPGNQTRKAILFIRDPDPIHEHREQRLLSPAQAREQSGIDTVYFVSQFEPFVDAILAGRPYGLDRLEPPLEFASFFDALAAARARLALVLEPKPGLSGPLGQVHQFANRVRERFTGVTIEDAAPLLADLRQIKTPYEQRVLARSLEITNDAHLAAMRAAQPGRYEYEVKAALEYVFRARGAWGWGYPPIVGSGPNATILHYPGAGRRLEDGDLLLVDAAANHEGLTGDVTRTYPVNGRFSEPQREIYRLVLTAQEAGMEAARPGTRTADVEKAAQEVIKAGLLSLGLITDTSGDQFRTWYTHGICHWIGLDVHDVGDYQRPLAPGMAFVIEPGLYIRQEALDQLPDTPENRAFIEQVRPAVERYRDIGIRIEDSFLLTERGLERLSATVPRTVEEIEAFLAGRPTPSGGRF